MATISEKEIKFNKEISETLYGNGKTFDEIVKADISENEFKEQAKKLLWTSEEIENFLSKHKEEIKIGKFTPLRIIMFENLVE
jgi:hypothetical protein|nr:MAG TPA: hypothetical protein [Caudoviricetes sp.]DAT83349.1 MAG TPA: hypothetical protein [Caudoviricetes sp.]